MSILCSQMLSWTACSSSYVIFYDLACLIELLSTREVGRARESASLSDLPSARELDGVS